ncbi:hypothetical protein [Glycocaulis sp.]
MALLLSNGLVYMHIPKTGGNWLTTLIERHHLVLSSLGHKHATYEALVGTEAEHAARRAGTAITGFFCVVRNPVSWYESWYKYQCHREWRQWGVVGDLSRWHVMSSLNMDAPTDFNTFIERVNRKSPGFVSQLYSRYTLDSGAFILKTESIRTDFAKLCQSTGLAVPEADVHSLAEIGVSPPKPIEWDPQLKKITVNNEIAAFHSYNYDPEEALA